MMRVIDPPSRRYARGDRGTTTRGPIANSELPGTAGPPPHNHPHWRGRGERICRCSGQFYDKVHVPVLHSLPGFNGGTRCGRTSARCSGHKTKSRTSARGASSVGVRAHTGITPWSRGQGQPDLNHDPYFDTQTTLPTTVAHRPRRPRRPAAARGRGRPLALSILSFIVLPHGRASSASLLVLPCITCSCFQCLQCFHARASL